MSATVAQKWDLIVRYHSLLSTYSAPDGGREPNGACVRLEQVVERLLRGNAIASFMLSQRADLIVYAIANFLSHARNSEIITLLVRR